MLMTLLGAVATAAAEAVETGAMLMVVFMVASPEIASGQVKRSIGMLAG